MKEITSITAIDGPFFDTFSLFTSSTEILFEKLSLAEKSITENGDRGELQDDSRIRGNRLDRHGLNRGQINKVRIIGTWMARRVCCNGVAEACAESGFVLVTHTPLWSGMLKAQDCKRYPNSSSCAILA
jgi:hypothetical protein